YVKISGSPENETENNIAFKYITVQGSGDAPIISITFPNITQVINGTIYITWTASDPNNDPLLFTIYYGNATQWIQIATDISTLYYQWNTNTVPDGNYKILINATDGFFTTSDTSDEFFTIDNEEEPQPPGGIPGFEFFLILVGLIAAIIAQYLHRKSFPKIKFYPIVFRRKEK
ncbi:MAG: Ig-like domain-containing protein, partial [Promethearchaeota archaeon]